jgi:hypothetical protein
LALIPKVRCKVSPWKRCGGEARAALHRRTNSKKYSISRVS